jgi:hypothetical protein
LASPVGNRDFLPSDLAGRQKTTATDDPPRRQPNFPATSRQQPRFLASPSSVTAISCQATRPAGRKQELRGMGGGASWCSIVCGIVEDPCPEDYD